MKGKKPSRFYNLSFRQIEKIVWEAIVKREDDKSFSNSWLLKKIKDCEQNE